MKIVVLLSAPRRGPDSGERIGVLSPFDLAALELALAAADRDAGDLVVALTAGLPDDDELLRGALRRGADEACRVWADDQEAAEKLELNLMAITELLAVTLREIEFDLVLAGARSVDWATGMTGPAVADHLDIPHLANVISLERATGDAALRAVQRRDGRALSFLVSPPALLTVLSAPTLGEREEVETPPERAVQVFDVAELGFETDDPLPWPLPPVDPAPATGADLVGDSAALVARLREMGVLPKT